jgi:NADPH2:quinone reductase
MTFGACRVFSSDGSIEARVASMAIDELSAGDVVVRVAYSSLNYKDARAVTGRGRPIMRRFPLNAGIDLAGVVETSSDPRFTPGREVIANGMGLGEAHDGGFAEYARVPGDWLMPLPAGLTLRGAMALGTAGYTAALCVHRMEINGQRPDMGPIVVTGATGGVGSIGVRLLASRGYQVIAVSGRPEHHAWLRGLGAADVRTADELELSGKPLDRTKFGGAIDNVGGALLANLLPHIVEWGNVASVGLAGGAELSTSVYPFILRGVSLLGINSVATPRDVRLAVWKRLATDLRPAKLDRIADKLVTFDELPAQFDDYIKGRVTGRTVIRISR